jgi:hypothetical protein
MKKGESDETSLYFYFRAFQGSWKNGHVEMLLLNRAFYLQRSGEEIAGRLNRKDSTRG